MTVDEILKKVSDGESVKVSLEKKTVKLNGSVINVEFEIPDNPEERLLEYFRVYKTSVPSAKADSKYFYAYDESKLSTKELVENENRYISRLRLEIYVLGLIVNNAWDFGSKWYWQSKEEPKLVLFKKWFN